MKTNNDFKDKGRSSNVFENIHNKTKEITSNLPDPLNLKVTNSNR